MFVSGRLVIRETLVTPGKICGNVRYMEAAEGSQTPRGNGRLVGKKAFRKNLYESIC